MRAMRRSSVSNFINKSTLHSCTPWALNWSAGSCKSTECGRGRKKPSQETQPWKPAREVHLSGNAEHP